MSLLAIPLIAGLIAIAYLACILGTILLGLPWDLSLPWPLRILGVLLIAVGSAAMASVFRFRGFRAVLDSTYATLMKLLRREPMVASVGRTEPLVMAGPYRYARHPLYSGVIALTFGIGLAVDHLWALLGAVILYLWFAFVLAPFEERELLALFGKDYEDYMRSHRRFLPVPRRAR
jgi:protein-S-isoprenylcysteine O-methyltransferase Ste14